MRSSVLQNTCQYNTKWKFSVRFSEKKNDVFCFNLNFINFEGCWATSCRFKISSCYEVSAIDFCWVVTLINKTSLKTKDINTFNMFGKYFWPNCFSLFTWCVLFLSHGYFKFVASSCLFFMVSSFHSLRNGLSCSYKIYSLLVSLWCPF